MNIKALRAFRLVVTEGSVSAAAKVLCLSQPAVSRLIALLENELKLTLFSRDGRRMVLTDQGAAFLQEAGRILANLDDIPRIASEIRNSGVRRLRLVTMPRVAMSLVCPAVAAFGRRYPDVHVSLDLKNRRDMEQWIAGKEYDLGIGGTPVAHRAALGQSLVRVRVGVLLPARHRLAAHAQIDCADLIGERLIAQMPGLQFRAQVDEIFASCGLQPDYRVQTSSSQMATRLVVEGGGLTLIDRLSAQAFLTPDVVLRPLLPERWFNFGIIRAREGRPGPLAEAFADCLKDEIGQRLVPGEIERVPA